MNSSSQDHVITGRVTVGIPTYNRYEDLKNALKVAKDQTYRNLEIIVSDNASTDLRIAEFLRIEARNDDRIKVFFQKENLGILKNTEFVLNQATGEYFMWLSDDDWRAPEFIETLVNLLNQSKEYAFAFCDYSECDHSGSWIPHYPRSHRNFFKHLNNKNRLLRVAAFAWTDLHFGLGNCFYAIFRTIELRKFSLRKLSRNYQKLNLDYLIAFSLTYNSPLAFSEDQMCKLTCENKKNYTANRSDFLWSKVKRKFEYRFPITYNRIGFLLDLVSITPTLRYRVLLCMLGIIRELWVLLRLIGKHFKLPNIQAQATKQRAHLVYCDSKVRLDLPKVTLVGVATKNVEETVEALRYSSQFANFNSVKLLAHFKPRIPYGTPIETLKIQKMKSIDDWSKFIVYDLTNYIDTEFALLIHADGFVVNPDSWKDSFLNYDYIGAPWPIPTDKISYRDPDGKLIRVGNSVSLRSKRILDFPRAAQLPWQSYNGYFNEDGFLCVKHRKDIEAAGMQFAPIDVAAQFAHETMLPETSNLRPFVFHKWAGTNAQYPNIVKAFEEYDDRY